MARWAWIQIDDPWEQWGPQEFTQHGHSQYGLNAEFRTFNTAHEARADLRTWLLEDSPGDKPLAELLTSVTGQEFMLWSMQPRRAWVVYRVRGDVHPALAGGLVHEKWKPQAIMAITRPSYDSEGRIKVRESGVWDPRVPGKASVVGPQSGGCAAALLLTICVIALLFL
ncbi:hypothetical protein ACFVT9_28950 [Kitasatospora cineracea]|uniref:hypothetical protein n=1 Tax=Kitasatospora cineracea TaxID=88074 RepID=UPI0036DF733A